MQDSEKQRFAGPRAWVFSLNYEELGIPLYEPQAIRDALRELMEGPSIGVAIARIPEMASKDIPEEEDVSFIGRHHGLIIMGPAPINNGAIGVLLLAREKMVLLERLNRTVRGLVFEVLRIPDYSKFCGLAARLRELRNQVAHPKSFATPVNDPDLSLISADDAMYIQRLLEWDSTPYEPKL
jgi:hypothetical protein